MNEFLKKIFTKAAALWAGWSTQQKIIFAAVAVVVIVGVFSLLRISSSPVLVSVFDAPIRDETALDRIILRLNEEGVKVNVTANGIVQVSDETTARRMRAMLIREDLVPSGLDPWDIFDRERWSITDMERNVNLRRSLTRMITDHIKSIDDVDDANVTIVWPERELFRSDRNPVSASVIITPKPRSDITENRKKIEGIQKLLKFAIEGLKDENIVITDNYANVLNDFEGMAASDRLSLIERESRIVLDIENRYRNLVLTALQATFSADRVRDLNIKIDMDMSKRVSEIEEIFPIIVIPRTPGLSYDDSERVMSVTRSSSTSSTKWEGTGFNPEGPTGTEPNVMPAFRDMSNLYGQMSQDTNVQNEEVNKTVTHEDRSPQIDRLTVSVNIDGRWKWKYDEKGNPVILSDNTIDREFIPVPEEDRRRAEDLIRYAVGYNSARGDSVVVTTIPFDRIQEHKAEDAAYFRQKQVQTTIIVFISGLILLLFGFILFRMISREMERRRRLAEEERARREQMLRESAMAEAEQEGMDVSISLEERTRMELMESAINMAKEHPEDAAQLIRTWLLEE
ncbi:MAG: flagellar M-ring protein FliF [Treponema sp.]|jgi:flagellar M-ring protein FliF|nr:flagellar M-ring protein FliF [Treponema sp.]